MGNLEPFSPLLLALELRETALDRQGLPPLPSGGRASAPGQRGRKRPPHRSHEIPLVAGKEEQHGVRQNNAQETGRSEAVSLCNR